jgi:hypothetical protein
MAAMFGLNGGFACVSMCALRPRIYLVAAACLAWVSVSLLSTAIQRSADAQRCLGWPHPQLEIEPRLTVAVLGGIKVEEKRGASSAPTRSCLGVPCQA